MNQKIRLAINLFIIVWAYVACFLCYKIYDGLARLRTFLNSEEGTYVSIDLPIVPTIFVILGFIIIAFLYFWYCKKRGMKLFSTKSLFYPIEFDEQDERELMINAKACRIAYIAVQISIVTGAVLIILLYPFIKARFASFPLLVLFLILFIQQIVHYCTFRKYS